MEVRVNRRLAQLYGGPAATAAMLPTTPPAPEPGGPAPVPTPPPAPPAPAPAPAPSHVTFTAEQQAKVDELMGQRAAQAERAAIQKVAEQLGMSPAEAKTFIEEKRAADDAAKSEEQKRTEQLQTKEAAIAAREAATAARERDADRRGLLAEFGATGQDLIDAAALLGTRVKDDATPDELRTAIEALKGQRGELFTGKAADPAPGRPPTPAPPAPAPQPGEFGKAGLDEAKRRGFIKDPAPA